MKTLLLLLLLWVLLDGSQDVLAGEVEVIEGAEPVLLPCRYFDYSPEHPLLMWNRSALTPESVHLRREEEDDLEQQSRRFRGRTSMNPDALDTGNFSLTLGNPQRSDSGNYTCSIYTGREEVTLAKVHLKVKDEQEEVEVTEGAESVLLPCRTSADLPADASVEWTRSEPEFMVVHLFSNTSECDTKQDGFYRGRTEMTGDPLVTGDLSLTLKFPREGDGGNYTCTVHRGQDILRHRVALKQVKARFPLWATALLVLLVLAVFVSAGVLYHLRQHFMSEYNVLLDYGMQSALLPCRTTLRLPADVRVEWTDGGDKKVHVYDKGSDQPEEQHQLYSKRTRMEKRLKYGDLSLTLDHPTLEDKNTYTCSVYSRTGDLLMKKRTHLQIIGVNEVKASRY